MKSYIEILRESFGPMGGDQRNMQGSSKSRGVNSQFDGSVEVSFPNSLKDKEVAKAMNKYKITAKSSNGDKIIFSGSQKNLVSFLVNQGWNKQDLKKWYTELF